MKIIALSNFVGHYEGRAEITKESKSALIVIKDNNCLIVYNLHDKGVRPIFYLKNHADIIIEKEGHSLTINATLKIESLKLSGDIEFIHEY